QLLYSLRGDSRPQLTHKLDTLLDLPAQVRGRCAARLSLGRERRLRGNSAGEQLLSVETRRLKPNSCLATGQTISGPFGQSGINATAWPCSDHAENKMVGIQNSLTAQQKRWHLLR